MKLSIHNDDLWMYFCFCAFVHKRSLKMLNLEIACEKLKHYSKLSNLLVGKDIEPTPSNQETSNNMRRGTVIVKVYDKHKARLAELLKY